ncbi:MAG: hypothetical protein H6737_31800 [Alphaproteobacteria bacterium]|nr:hypothetical protein [Alphaproteobacteria bacterium]
MDAEHRQFLKLAYALEYASRIVAADGFESFEEYHLLGQVFPRTLLRQAGFLGEDGHLTERFEAYRDAAHNVLPQDCSHDEKVEIFTLLFACSAADELQIEEMGVLLEAGEVLGMPESEVTALIGALSAEA